MSNSFSRILPSGHRVPQSKASGPNSFRRSDGENQEYVLVENVFHSMLTLERRRAERSGKPFVLMLLDANSENGAAKGILTEAVHAVVTSKRETDLAGWYKQGAILGIMFTEVNQEADVPVTETLRSKMEAAFVKHLGRERAVKVAISVHLFPENWGKRDSQWAEDSNVYRALNKKVS